jgi:hypothetical protein
MVVVENNSLDGTGMNIIVHKTSKTRFPAIRLVDIPGNLPLDEKNSIVKVAIKQRPQKGSHGTAGGMNSHSSNPNHAKSVEERKEEYNKARARIFNINSSTTSGSNSTEDKPVAFDNCQFHEYEYRHWSLVLCIVCFMFPVCS